MEGGGTPRTPTPESAQKQEPQPPEAVTVEEPEAATEPQLSPQIYVASLSDYNAGRLHGVWLDAWQEPDEMESRIRNMLARSPEPGAEEWGIHDFTDFNGLHLGEGENLGYISKVGKGIRAHGLAYAHWATLAERDEELEQFSERYLGHWPSLTAYAENILDDLSLDQELDRLVPEHLRPYVTLDAEGFGRDLKLSGDVQVVEGDGGVYVYSSR